MEKMKLEEWEDWIDAQDVSLKLNITVRTLQRWRLAGVLPHTRIKGKIYYKMSDILKLLNENYNGEKGGSDE